MSQFHNTLPAEFEQEHGTTTLGADDQPIVELDEDLVFDLTHAQQRVWLVKVPKFLMEKWSESPQEGALLGRVRVYDEKDSDGNPKIAVILEEGASKPSGYNLAPAPDVKGKRKAAAVKVGRESKPVLSEYKLVLHNTDSKNMFVFGEKEEEMKDEDEDEEGGYRKKRRLTSMLGKIHHECQLMPSLANGGDAAAYRTIMRERQRVATEPKRTIKRLDVDEGTANRLASGMGLGGLNTKTSTFVKAKVTGQKSGEGRAARIPKNELLDLLFTHFESRPYWTIKALTEHVKQPQVYLKEVLAEIGILVPRGPYANMWKLKDEYKGSVSAQKPDEGEGENEDDEDEMEEVK